MSRIALIALIAAGLCACNKPRPAGPRQGPLTGPGTTRAPEPEAPARSEPEPTPPAQPAGPKVAAGDGSTLFLIVAPSLEAPTRELGRRYRETTGQKVDVRAANVYDALQRMAESEVDVLVLEGYTSAEAIRATDLLVDGSLRTVTHLPLTITVAGPKADTIRTMSDLDAAGIRLGLPDPRRSVGATAARRLLERATISDAPERRVLPGSVRNALRDGSVDAYVGWGRQDAGVPLRLPAALREHLPVPAGVSSLSRRPESAARLVEWLASDAATTTWERAGTVRTPPTGLPVLPTILPMKLPGARKLAGSAVVGQRILVVGGSSGQLSNRLTWVDPGKVTAEDAGATLPGGLEGPAVEHHTKLRRVLVAGGRKKSGPTSQIHRYDPDAGTVGRLPAVLPSARSALASAPAPGGLIWLLGGRTARGPTAEIVAFDPADGSVARVAARLSRPVAHPVVTRWQGSWLVAGGRGPTGPVDRVDLLDEDGTSTPLPHRLPTPLAGAVAHRLGEHVYVIGGVSSSRIESAVIRFPF